MLKTSWALFFLSLQIVLESLGDARANVEVKSWKLLSLTDFVYVLLLRG